jgi:hypothetical protein
LLKSASGIVHSKSSKEIKANILSGKISINGITHNFRARDSYDAISRNYLDEKIGEGSDL